MSSQITTSGNTTQLKTYSYKARTIDGTVVSGTAQALRPDDVAAEILARKQVPINITGDSWLSTLLSIQSLPRHEIRRTDLVDLMRELASNYEARLDPRLSIEIARDDITDPFLESVMRNIQTSINNGSSLSAAMREQGKAFPPLVIDLVAAGEDSGQMHLAMAQVADQLEKAAERRSKIISGLTYPGIVLAVAIGVAIFAMLVVVPGFTASFADVDAELPRMTQMLVTFSDITRAVVPILAVVAVIGGILYRRNRHLDSVRTVVDRRKTKVPVFGPLSHSISLAMFCRTLSNLHAAGRHPVPALEIASRTLNNIHMERAIMDAAQKVDRGQPLSAALRDSPLFPAALVKYIRAGETGNKTGVMLAHAATRYEKLAERRADRLAKSLSPMVMVVVAVMVGFLGFAITAPNFAFIDAINP